MSSSAGDWLSEAPSTTTLTTDYCYFLLFTFHFLLLLPTYRLLPIRQIDHDRVAGADQILGRDHDLLAPLPCARAEDGLFNETRLEEGPESMGLPAKGGDGADHISCSLLDNLRVRHFDVPRADRLFEIPRDRV